MAAVFGEGPATSVLLSAQHFGFGPMAELLAILNALNNDSRIMSMQLFLEDKVPLRPLFSVSRQEITIIPNCSENRPLVARLATRELKIDVVLSSFDSEAVFAAWFCRLRVFLYDGLFWFWGWEHLWDRAHAELESLSRIRDEGDVSRFHAIYQHLVMENYHLTMLIAYLLATHVYVQKAIGVEARLSRFPKLSRIVQVVNGLVSIDREGSICKERTHVLVTLSGSLAPLLTFEQNMVYARGALNFAREAFVNSGSSLPWIFSCHPDIHAELEKSGQLVDVPEGFSVTPSWGLDQNNKMIATSHAILTSPGFKSVQEAAYFNSPVFFLPEQNGGQPRNFQMLRESGYDCRYNLTVTDQIHGGKCIIDENDVPLLYAGIITLWSEEMRTKRLELVKCFLEMMDNMAERDLVISRQVDTVRKVFGGFNGATQVSEHFLGKVMPR